MNQLWNASDIPSLVGKRIVITGANSGIGYQTALELARKDAQVILACRDKQRGAMAVARLREELPQANLELTDLDLASLDSVHNFATIELNRNQPLHVLLNNAGVMAPPKRIETAEGFELQFGTNVLGHFALTALLMPALQRGANKSSDRPRIVTLTSIAHKQGRIDFSDLQSVKRYSPLRAYQQSKLADLMFSLELDRRLRAAGSPIMSIAVHPGVANTNLFRAGDRSAVSKIFRSLFTQTIGVLLNTEAVGALPTLYAATATHVRDGGYYGPSGFFEMRGKAIGEAKIAKRAQDADAAARLWQVCEELTGVRFHF